MVFRSSAYVAEGRALGAAARDGCGPPASRLEALVGERLHVRREGLLDAAHVGL